MIQAYGSCIAAGFICAVFLISYDKKYRTKLGLTNINYIHDLIAIIGFAGILGGRLVCFFENPCIEKLSTILCIWQGGFSVLGSVAGSFLAAFIWARLNKVSFIKSIDFLAVYTPLVHATGRIGCFFAGCCSGLLAWNGFHFQLPLIMALYYFIVFIALYLIRLSVHKGTISALYLMAAGFERYFFDRFREDRCIIYENWSRYEIIGAAFFLMGLSALLIVFIKNAKQKIKN